MLACLTSFLSSVVVVQGLLNQCQLLTQTLKNCKQENLNAVLKKESPRAVVAGFAHEVQCLVLLQKFRVSDPPLAPQTLKEAVNKLLDEPMKMNFLINNPTEASTLWKEAKPYSNGPSDGTILSLQGHLHSS
jgi:hypothetical protein